MNRRLETMIVAAALALAAPARISAAKAAAATSEAKDAKSVIASWPELTRTGAAALIAKYGPPDTVSDEQLVWNNKDKWKKVAVYRNMVRDWEPAEMQRFIVNEVNYKVPENKAPLLLRFDRGLVIDEVRGTLAAQGESEKYNMLVLNLADEIASGKRTLFSAQKFFKKTQKAIAAGKSFTYLDEFMFEPGAVDAVPTENMPALPGFNKP